MLEAITILKEQFNRESVLKWTETVYRVWDAQVGTPDDGVHFSLCYRPTCYRRGQWRLLIEVCGGPRHLDWGCFDEADQPMRNYHIKDSALQEANAIARVLIKDRMSRGGKGETDTEKQDSPSHQESSMGGNPSGS